MAYVRKQKVMFQHCDPAGIVFYPRYFEMLNAAVEDWFAERLGTDFAALHGTMRAGIPTVQIETRFTAPSRLGDALEISLGIARLGRTSVSLSYEVTCGGEARLSASSTVVFISLDDGRPRPWPDAIRKALEAEAQG